MLDFIKILTWPGALSNKKGDYEINSQGYRFSLSDLQFDYHRQFFPVL
jgi:hypothetical protein